MEIGRRAPQLDQGWRVEQSGRLIERSAGADVIGLQVGEQAGRMTNVTVGLTEDAFAAPRRFREFAVHQVRAGHRLQGHEIGVHRLRHVLGLHCEQDVADPGANCHLGGFPHADAHGWGSEVGEQHALVVLRIANPVVEQVPVEGVHPAVARMAGRTALPALETDVGVVEEILAFANLAHGLLGSQPHRDPSGMARRQIEHGQSIREIICHINLAAHHHRRPRTTIGLRQPVTLADPHQERKVVGHIGLNSGGGVDGSAAGLEGGGQLIEFGQQTRKIDDADLVGPGVGDHQAPPICAPGDPPRIGRAAVNIVKQDGVDDLQRGQVDKGFGVGAHPAAIDLGRRQGVTRQYMAHRRIPSIRRDPQVLEHPAAIRQGQFLYHLAKCGVDHAHYRRHMFRVGPAVVEQVSHQ